MSAEAAEPVIDLRDFSFTYRGATAPALRDVSLTVRPGEFVVVMGATGAGKSTLAKCLNGSIPQFQPGELRGAVRVLGRSLAGVSVSDLAGAVGLVSQDFEAQLFSTNVRQEVAFGMEQLGVARAEMAARLPAVLARVGLSGFEARDPTTLSGGEKQRLAIAALLALEPALLVFDEPTTDLDPLSKDDVFAVLAALRAQGRTVVLIEHETQAAVGADRLLLMDGGRIVADGVPPELLRDVAQLRRLGVRPLDLDCIGAAYGWPVVRDIDAAAARLALLAPPEPARWADRGPSTSSGRTEVGATGSGRTEVDAAGAGRRELNGPGAGHEAAPADAPLIQVEHAGFAYPGGPPVLRDVSLQLRGGEFVALIGQNGSGKTTLAKCLNGLLQPQQGRILLRGAPLRGLSLHQVAGEVGYVFQNPDQQIFAATVGDEAAFAPRNFGWPVEEVARRTAAALTAVGLEGREAVDPFLLGKGERQRLAVASLLALQPAALVLDEPTTGLDDREQRRMLDLLAELHRGGMTVVVITHSPWVVAHYAERGIVLEAGGLAFDGPLRALFAEEALLARCRFRLPDVTRVGRRLGFTPLTVEELLAAVRPAPGA
ncbi:MAG: ABC transporter ATP-binding protein [Candidatus Binatia bacterium]